MARFRSIALVPVVLSLASYAFAQDDTAVATHIRASEVLDTIAQAPPGRVSDQQIRHVDAGDGALGVGVVQRPPMTMGSPVVGIQHHQQAEVYRVVSGSGTLVTAPSLVDAVPLDPDGQVVRTLTGPSSRGGIDGGESRKIEAGDIVILPAGVAHGFSEITETITYLVVRIDPQELVELK